jgi:hypothetical protein
MTTSTTTSEEKSPKPEEGMPCPHTGCDGELEFQPVENCSCHINPPCPGCVEQTLWCPTCGWEYERDA